MPLWKATDKKIAGITQEELAKVLQQSIRDAGQHNLLVSVMKVSITVGLSIAKVYLSVFPDEKVPEIQRIDFQYVND